MTQSHPLLQFGLPPDGVAWAALVVGLGCAIAVSRPRLRGRLSGALCERPGPTLGALAVLAALLSVGYVHFYLRGGPRIIDATAYLLQARTLAEGSMTFDVPAPSAAFRGRFLVPSPDAAQVSLGVLFPPGYPALLALGAAAGHPLLVGPLLGAALVAVTYALAFRLSNRRDVALLAAGLSALSAALRYHTADTMSHGLAALLFTGALRAALGPAAPTSTTARHAAFTAVAGLCTGWLLATRPLTGLVCAAGCAWLMLRSTPVPESAGALRRALLFGAALTPGVLLLLWHQLELTGHLLGSPQLRYYQLADGPPGCFGVGMSAELGCHHEHGDVVARFGQRGFGPLFALQNTLHRLHHHSLDFINWEPAWLLVPWSVWRMRRSGEVLVLGVVALGVMVGYAGFYFHGNYPGGGARFFAELLPLEHAVVAMGCAGGTWSRWLAPAALLGFACHGSYSHRHLAEREGGRPLFEPEVLERSLRDHTAPALVFVDTDHGFNLGHDPSPDRRWLVARSTSADLDHLLWQRLGRPPAYRYIRSVPAQLIELVPTTTQSVRIEAEHDWPPLSVRGGWVEPVFPACASGGRALTLHTTTGNSSFQGELNVPVPGEYRISVGLVVPPSIHPASPERRPPSGVRLVVGGQALPIEVPPAEARELCVRVELGALDLPTVARWTLQTDNRSPAVDYLEVTPTGAPRSGPEPPRAAGAVPR